MPYSNSHNKQMYVHIIIRATHILMLTNTHTHTHIHMHTCMYTVIHTLTYLEHELSDLKDRTAGRLYVSRGIKLISNDRYDT